LLSKDSADRKAPPTSRKEGKGQRGSGQPNSHTGEEQGEGIHIAGAQGRATSHELPPPFP